MEGGRGGNVSKTSEDRKSKIEEEALVFTGSMDWLPNDDAMVYFCKDILPLIWEKKPDVTIYIVGKSPSAELKKLAEHDNRIEVTGRVDDVRPYMEQAKVFVTPLRIGGGTRLKILEAMSMEKAVVSTSIGAEGIDYTKDSDISIADQPQEFADVVISLLNSDEDRKSMGENGRKLVLEKYDWGIIGKKLREIYGKLVNGE